MPRPIGQWRALALRSPFVLALDDGERLAIPWPSPDALLSAGVAVGTRGALVTLTGDRTANLLRALGEHDFQVARDVADDMLAHFGCQRSRQLLSLLERYGDEIATDLCDAYGLDMLDVFRGTITPDELMARIEGLPRHSRYAAAMAQDDELAERDAAAAAGNPSKAPADPAVTFTEFTPEAELLTVAVDRLGAVIETISAIAGGKVQLPPMPRPVGAASRLADRLENEAYDDVVADVAAAQERWAAQYSDTIPEEV